MDVDITCDDESGWDVTLLVESGGVCIEKKGEEIRHKAGGTRRNVFFWHQLTPHGTNK